MNLALWTVLFISMQLPAVPASPRTGTASVEGMIVRLGTNEPIGGVDLELTEVSAATSAQAVPAGSAGSTPPPAALHARGEVIDGTTGNPAAGANFRLVPRVFNTHMIVPNTVTDANGLFDVTGVVPGAYSLYFLGAQVPRRPSARGVPPITVTIVLGSDHGVVEGRVVNERQDPAVNVKVALVPDAPLRSRGDPYKSTTTDITGAYRIPLLPPGDYKIFAWEEAEDGAWRDSDFLRSDEARSKSLRLGALRTESATLTVTSARR